MIVWVVTDREEASCLGVALTADIGKQIAADEEGTALRWEERRDGRFVDTGWIYEVRPFELIPQEGT